MATIALVRFGKVGGDPNDVISHEGQLDEPSHLLLRDRRVTQYFFDIVVDGKAAGDFEGSELPDAEVAKEEAMLNLLEIAKGVLSARLTDTVLECIVRDQRQPVAKACLRLEFRAL
jgi:hypothetical protein